MPSWNEVAIAAGGKKIVEGQAEAKAGSVGTAGSAGGDGDGEGLDQAGSDPQEGRSLPDRFAHPAEVAPGRGTADRRG